MSSPFLQIKRASSPLLIVVGEKYMHESRDRRSACGASCLNLIFTILIILFTVTKWVHFLIYLDPLLSLETNVHFYERFVCLLRSKACGLRVFFKM